LICACLIRRFLTIIFALIICFGVAVIATTLIYLCSQPVAKACRPNRRFLRRLWVIMQSGLVKLKIALSFYQVVTLVGTTYKVPMPKNVVNLLDVFKIGVEIDRWGLHLSCYGWGGFRGELWFLMLWPVFAIFLIGPLIATLFSVVNQTTTLKEVLSGARGDRSLLNAIIFPFWLPWSLFVLFLAYPAISALAFRAFEECEKWADERNQPVRYLVSASKNFAIDCDSEELSRAQELAIGAIIFYPIGVLLLCASLLYSARGALLYQVHTPFSRALGFLCSSFQPAFFFFGEQRWIRTQIALFRDRLRQTPFCSCSRVIQEWLESTMSQICSRWPRSYCLSGLHPSYRAARSGSSLLAGWSRCSS
jgi:hypothetical protein